FQGRGLNDVSDRQGLVLGIVLLGACSFTSPALAQVPTKIEVPATAEWTDTGIDLLPGDTLRIRAAGEWSNVATGGYVGPQGYSSGAYPGTQLPGAPLAALIARIGNSLVNVEPARIIEVRSRGRLSLGMNDVPGTFSDNRGKVTAYIQYVQR